MKRVLQVVGAVIVALVIALASLWYSLFANNKPISDGQLVLPGVAVVKDAYVSSFLVDAGAAKVALIDAGNSSSAAPILQALEKRGLTKSAVTAIFLTHGHGDHTAGCKAFPDAQIYALEAELPTVGDAAKIRHPLHDGETVTLGDLVIQTFAVPGHTPGSAVYLARGVLFFGDSAGASKEGTVMKAVRLFSKDSEQNVAALKALTTRLAPRAAEIKQLAFAHTGTLEGFAPLIAFAAGH